MDSKLFVFMFAALLTVNTSYAVNTTIVGTLGDLDNNGDAGAGEAAIVQAAANCWDARITTNRNFTLNVAPVALTGGTLGTGWTTTVSGANIPTAGNVNFDNDGSTNWYVDPNPLDSLEFTPDPTSQWRFTNGPAQSDLWSTVHHEVGHAFGWLCGAPCSFTNPNFDALMAPAPGLFASNASCTAPFPLAGQAALAGCVNLQGGGFGVSLRGDGLGGSGSSVVNELSHPGVGSDLMEGFSGAGQRETPSISDVSMFNAAYGDNVNLPLTVNAGNDVTQECSAPGGADVNLDGTGSTDPENDPITYGWACPGVTLTGAATAMPNGFFPVNQTVTCRMDATDLPVCAPDADTVNVMVVDTTAPDITCPDDIVVECSTPGGTPATDPAITALLNGAIAADVCDSTTPLSDNAPGFFPLGNTLVEFSSGDDSGNTNSCLAAVDVEDTIAPTIVSVSATPNSQWPPNHKLVAVTVDVEVEDACDTSAACMIVDVSSNEPLNDIGDGNTSPDWVVTGDLTVDLRAERAGSLDGRVYTIDIECGDGSGNTSMASVEVSVAHNQ